jgi:hypothetical protein
MGGWAGVSAGDDVSHLGAGAKALGARVIVVGGAVAETRIVIHRALCPRHRRPPLAPRCSSPAPTHLGVDLDHVLDLARHLLDLGDKLIVRGGGARGGDGVGGVARAVGGGRVGGLPAVGVEVDPLGHCG